MVSARRSPVIQKWVISPESAKMKPAIELYNEIMARLDVLERLLGKPPELVEKEEAAPIVIKRPPGRPKREA